MTDSLAVPHITIPEIIDNYDAVLIDAYGVLIHRDGAFDGAAAFIAKLTALGKPYYILTNDASRNAETASAAYGKRGIEIPAERVITSGSLLVPYFHENNLAGARCVVLGPADSKAYVESAGGIVVSPFDIGDTDDVDVIVACDDAGYPFLESVEAVMSILFRRFDAGKETKLLLPNPDLIYQKNERDFGFTAGSIALLIEHALQLRYLHDKHKFLPLGKPHAPIFAEAESRTSSHKMVMLGDQLRTDIAGANGYGIDSVLVTTGLVQIDEKTLPDEWRPTYQIATLT